jgi:hypothetical protein
VLSILPQTRQMNFSRGLKRGEKFSLELASLMTKKLIVLRFRMDDRDVIPHKLLGFGSVTAKVAFEKIFNWDR